MVQFSAAVTYISLCAICCDLGVFLPVPKGSSIPASPRIVSYHLLQSIHSIITFPHSWLLREKGWKQPPVCGLSQAGSPEEEQELETTGGVCRQNWEQRRKSLPEDQKTSFKTEWALGSVALRSQMEESCSSSATACSQPEQRRALCEQEQHFPDPWPSS